MVENFNWDIFTSSDQSLLDIARSVYAQFQNTMSIEDIGKLLRDTDWNSLLSAVKQEREENYNTFWNEMVTCTSCEIQLKRKDCFQRGNIPFRIPLSIGTYCISCAKEILLEWEMCCVLCGTRYYKQARNTAHSLCDSCATPQNVRESRRLISHIGRISGNNIDDVISLSQWINTLNYFSWMCAYCQSVSFTDIDHFIPISLDGKHVASNCVPSCDTCNSKKKDTHPDKIVSIPRSDIERVRAYLATQNAAADHLGLDIAV